MPHFLLPAHSAITHMVLAVFALPLPLASITGVGAKPPMMETTSAAPGGGLDPKTAVEDVCSSPADVCDAATTSTATAVTAAAESLHSSAGPATPSAAAAAASASPQQQRPCSSASPPPSLSSSASASDLQAAAAAQDAQQQQQQQQQQRRQLGGGGAPSPSAASSAAALDVPALVLRLQQRPLTGQVVAWGWACAARASCVRLGLLTTQLFSALWVASEACCAQKPMMPQDVLEVLESWLTLMQQCPRHFRLSRHVLHDMALYALPATVKRMDERQLATLAWLARDIALHRVEEVDLLAAVSLSPRRDGASARDLMLPVFALVAAEAAWRAANPARYISPQTVAAVVLAAPAWNWRLPPPHRQKAKDAGLAALKRATAAALESLAPHCPEELRQCSALAKHLRTGASGASWGGEGGSSSRASDSCSVRSAGPV